MEKESHGQSKPLRLLYHILSSFILDSFDLVGVEDNPIENPTPDLLYPSVLHLYLDERDSRTPEQAGLLSPNGFTEPAQQQLRPMVAQRQGVVPLG